MIYKVFIGFNTAEEPMYKWHCDCKKCVATGGQCQEVMAANFKEKMKPQNTALYASLRR